MPEDFQRMSEWLTRPAKTLAEAEREVTEAAIDLEKARRNLKYAEERFAKTIEEVIRLGQQKTNK